jgi:LytS/YehU family sensor histidine kinase
MKNDKKTVTLKEEIQLCKDFISLNQIRFGDALKVSFGLEKESGKIFVPYFAVLSLIENAIKHNSLTKENPLEIRVTQKPEMLEVSNRKNAKFLIESQSRTGLHNLNERYKLISGREIRVSDDTAEFVVQLPLLLQ